MKHAHILPDSTIYYRSEVSSNIMININTSVELEKAHKWELEILSRMQELLDIELLMYKEMAWKQACQFKSVKHLEEFERLLTTEQKNQVSTTLEKWSNLWLAITDQINKRAITHREKLLNAIEERKVVN